MWGRPPGLREASRPPSPTQSPRNHNHEKHPQNHVGQALGLRGSPGPALHSFTQGTISMKNIWIICRKELKSYFASPIAYLVITCFALIWGFVFWMNTREFVHFGFMAEMQGRNMPMNVNEQVIRPLLGFAATVALFLIPMITMRLFAEEKKTGTIELYMTSPVYDWEIILGKWLGALFLYFCVLATSAINIALLFAFGKPDWKPILIGYLGLILQGGTLLAIGTLISTFTKNQIVAGGATSFVCLLQI